MQPHSPNKQTRFDVRLSVRGFPLHPSGSIDPSLIFPFYLLLSTGSAFLNHFPLPFPVPPSPFFRFLSSSFLPFLSIQRIREWTLLKPNDMQLIQAPLSLSVRHMHVRTYQQATTP